MSNPILWFNGTDYDFLSNFHASPIPVPDRAAFPLPDGLMLAPTVEHAYQALKAANKPDLLWVLQADGPGLAKKRGQKKGVDGVRIAVRPRWDVIKFDVMLACLRAKFEPGSALAERLLRTGYRMLVEGNTWGDRIWGATWEPEQLSMDADGRKVWARRGGTLPDSMDVQEVLVGENWLGRTLMLVRAELDYGARP